VLLGGGVLVAGLVAADSAPPQGYRTVTILTAGSAQASIGGHTVVFTDLNAALTNGRTPVPTAGATVTFSVGSFSCSAVTNANGLASCGGRSPKTTALLKSMSGHTYSASFAGTADFEPSRATGSLRD
jgi:hypothetical protein